jgi:hypothetical protein
MKSIKIKIYRKEAYGLIQNKMVQPCIGRQQEEWQQLARNQTEKIMGIKCSFCSVIFDVERKGNFNQNKK